MAQQQTDYVPALRFRSLTSLYDSVLHRTLREDTFKRRLVEQAAIRDGHRVLDLGCGTATLTLLAKKTHPGAEAELVGLDGDPHVLAIARSKAARAWLEIALDEGMSYQLPYPDGSFDRVLSSLLFHHLDRESKQRTLQEVLRVLRPGGQLHVADWGRPPNLLLRAAFLPVQVLDGFRNTTENVQGVLPAFFVTNGFKDVRETGRVATALGSISLYAAARPGADGAG